MPVVRIENYSPNMEKVCAKAAKLCYSAGYPADADVTPSKAIGLLEKILSLGHLSILEHVSVTFGIEGISRACSHQLVRHRVGVVFSQQSQRYVQAPRPGEAEVIMPPSIAKADMEDYFRMVCERQYLAYMEFVRAGVPAEDARYVLPNAAETKLIMTMNARELLHFFTLRTCNRAQWEIRAMANEMLRLCKGTSPTLFKLAGAGCVHGTCPEGEMGCGIWLKSTSDGEL